MGAKILRHFQVTLIGKILAWLDQGCYSNLGVSPLTDCFNYVSGTGEEGQKEDLECYE